MARAAARCRASRERSVRGSSSPARSSRGSSRRPRHMAASRPRAVPTCAMWLVRLDEPLLDRAGELEPRTLRSLDAMHLAAALAIGPELGAFLTYDERLAEAARGVGLTVHAPG